MNKKTDLSNGDGAFILSNPQQQKNYAASALTVKKKKASTATEETKSAELASFEKKAQITAALVKTLFSLSNEFILVLSKLVSSATDQKNLVVDFEAHCVSYTKELLQKVADILTTLKIYKDDQATWDALLRPINALVTTTVNIKPRFVEEEKTTNSKDYVCLTFQKVSENLKALLNEVRLVVATQLSFIHFDVLSSGNGSNIPIDSVGTAKVLKTVKVISTLRRYLLNKTDSEVIMKGSLLKKGKGDVTLTKSWKKCYFTLDNDKLMYSDREGDTKTIKTVFSYSFTKIEDAGDQYQKPFSFVIHAEYPIVLSAPSETEYNEWVMKLNEVIRNTRNIRADAVDLKSFKPIELDWSIFKDTELRDLLKSYDREEKYLTETTKIIYLQRMKEIVQKIEKVSTKENKPKLFVPPNTDFLDSKSQEYAEIQSRRSKFQAMPTEQAKFLDVAKSDPSAYLAEVIGFGIHDFSLV